MPTNETLVAKSCLETNEVLNFRESDFFEKHNIEKINPEDCVIVWVSLKIHEHKKIFKNLDCRKFLKVIDVSSGDLVPLKSIMEDLNQDIYEAILITYHSDVYLKILDSMNQNYIFWPHSLNFEDRDYSKIKKEFDVVISGQFCETGYPVRTKIAQNLVKLSEKAGIKTIYLSHPGYKISERRHKYYGEDYIELLSRCRLVLTCSADRDVMVMKYIESAKSFSLPIGEVPTYMPELAKNSMLELKTTDSETETINKIKALLENEKGLKDRITNYHKSIKGYGSVEKVILGVLNKIKNRNYDKSKQALAEMK